MTHSKPENWKFTSFSHHQIMICQWKYAGWYTKVSEMNIVYIILKFRQWVENSQSSSNPVTTHHSNCSLCLVCKYYCVFDFKNIQLQNYSAEVRSACLFIWLDNNIKRFQAVKPRIYQGGSILLWKEGERGSQEFWATFGLHHVLCGLGKMSTM